MHRSLAGRIHLGAGLNEIAHHDGFHLIWANAGARDRGADRGRPETGRWYVLETAAERADRGADRLGNYD
jgi:hypothetical protein